MAFHEDDSKVGSGGRLNDFFSVSAVVADMGANSPPRVSITCIERQGCCDNRRNPGPVVFHNLYMHIDNIQIEYDLIKSDSCPEPAPQTYSIYGMGLSTLCIKLAFQNCAIEDRSNN